jgi:5-formyltetrahydrofolate cyclo-ligase
MTDLKSEKALVRKDIRDQLKTLSVGQRHEWSARITKRLLELPEYKQAKVLMVFLSFSKEYDTESLILHGLSAGKTVCAPKVEWQTWKMVPVKLHGLDEIVKDMHGLREPTGEEKVDVDRIDLVLVPGLAFDPFGRRVGRGGGFYDAFLSRIDLRAVKLAPTFDFQLRPTVPFDCHDQPVDIILTPTKTLRFRV